MTTVSERARATERHGNVPKSTGRATAGATARPQPQAESTPQPLTTSDLREMLRVRFAPPEWFTTEEATFSGRRIDFMAMNLWAARGYRVVGCEIKVSRSDWLRELADWQKAADWHRAVDDFFVVAPAKLVRPDEVPDGWGLLEVRGTRLFTVKHPPKSETRREFPREITARLLNRAHEAILRERRHLDVAARVELRAEVTAQVQKEFETELAALRPLEKRHRDLLRTLNVNPLDWQVDQRAARTASVLADLLHSPESVAAHAKSAAETVERTATAFTNIAARLREAIQQFGEEHA